MLVNTLLVQTQDPFIFIMVSIWTTLELEVEVLLLICPQFQLVFDREREVQSTFHFLCGVLLASKWLLGAIQGAGCYL